MEAEQEKKNTHADKEPQQKTRGGEGKASAGEWRVGGGERRRAGEAGSQVQVTRRATRRVQIQERSERRGRKWGRGMKEGPREVRRANSCPGKARKKLEKEEKSGSQEHGKLVRSRVKLGRYRRRNGARRTHGRTHALEGREERTALHGSGPART